MAIAHLAAWRAMKPLYQRPFDLVQVLYFLVHIPTTLLIDSQSLAPSSWYPNAARELLQWHIKTNNDHLVSPVAENPPWFVALVVCEVVLQLPAFLVLAYGLAYYKPWVRIPCIIYGTHVATTLVPILADFIFGNHATNPNWVAVAIYSPYLLLPLALAVRMAMVDYGKGGRGGSKAKRV
ncbi:hypothetical protein QJQ45_018099 [Haematococcus lacustris]|nr:hypothetical protein QJQ45_018099 [Haematococcus lacustris]